MRDFKFLDDNKHFFPTPYLISEEEINLAISRGRQSYLNGDDLEITPYLTPELIEAFQQGWELEQDYEILRQAQQRANETEQHN
jgi:ribosome modulation factor